MATAEEEVVVDVNDYDVSDPLLRPDDVTQALRGKPMVQITSRARAQARWASRQCTALPDVGLAVRHPPGDFAVLSRFLR
ncbi:hypothetical protein BHS09_19210 [Myxococcus xanthus]|uniref:Uncharacterized protein n=1 Tax=Myxococcus xanthus TaxID=34 RepID=A0AAE6G1F0_MYXXA|nr:hypothetical protein [Myxococcus xanthus]QDE68940.1 hypothetical protein BHS09_19210 [Myxococcus xanthus]QDE76216.1 hypothetical protein BHS08_19225 [Myxococcus xanthus]